MCPDACDKVKTRGEIVVLGSFTCCCINYTHILTQLRQLEEQYCAQDGVVVVVSESSVHNYLSRCNRIWSYNFHKHYT